MSVQTHLRNELGRSSNHYGAKGATTDIAQSCLAQQVGRIPTGTDLAEMKKMLAAAGFGTRFRAAVSFQ